MIVDYHFIEEKGHGGKIILEDESMPQDDDAYGETQLENPGDLNRTNRWTDNETIHLNRKKLMAKYQNVCARCPQMTTELKQCLITDFAYGVLRHEMCHANCDVGNSQTKFEANECRCWGEQTDLMCAYQEAIQKYEVPAGPPLGSECTAWWNWNFYKEATKGTRDVYCG